MGRQVRRRRRIEHRLLPHFADHLPHRLLDPVDFLFREPVRHAGALLLPEFPEMSAERFAGRLVLLGSFQEQSEGDIDISNSAELPGDPGQPVANFRPRGSLSRPQLPGGQKTARRHAGIVDGVDVRRVFPDSAKLGRQPLRQPVQRVVPAGAEISAGFHGAGGAPSLRTSKITSRSNTFRNRSARRPAA